MASHSSSVISHSKVKYLAAGLATLFISFPAVSIPNPHAPQASGLTDARLRREHGAGCALRPGQPQFTDHLHF
ncbi:MAG: hypothetical protein HUU04_03570 [Verrucomicrobiae bacterium]|nr:hypothetical protein [Verrucomicrobiae bacterium]